MFFDPLTNKSVIRKRILDYAIHFAECLVVLP